MTLVPWVVVVLVAGVGYWARRHPRVDGLLAWLLVAAVAVFVLSFVVLAFDH